MCAWPAKARASQLRQTKRHSPWPYRRGKTYLIRNAADLIGVPFVKADATKFSETGYVGADVEDLVRELLRRADNDVERAQYGIIYIDEIDKIASASNASGGMSAGGASRPTCSS
jgi:ATP-dependent Clp protease ATP-binding subunit ClpX